MPQEFGPSPVVVGMLQADLPVTRDTSFVIYGILSLKAPKGQKYSKDLLFKFSVF